MNGNGKGNSAMSKRQNVETDGPFELAHAIVKAAVRCAADADQTPYAVVLGRVCLGHAQTIWDGITGGRTTESGVRLDILPDVRTNGTKAVLLFSKLKEGE